MAQETKDYLIVGSTYATTLTGGYVIGEAISGALTDDFWAHAVIDGLVMAGALVLLIKFHNL